VTSSNCAECHLCIWMKYYFKATKSPNICAYRWYFSALVILAMVSAPNNIYIVYKFYHWYCCGLSAFEQQKTTWWLSGLAIILSLHICYVVFIPPTCIIYLYHSGLSFSYITCTINCTICLYHLPISPILFYTCWIAQSIL